MRTNRLCQCQAERIRAFEATDVATTVAGGTARDEEPELALIERRRAAAGRADDDQSGYQEPHEWLRAWRTSSNTLSLVAAISIP